MSTHHKLLADVDTVHRGAFDARFAPKLKIESGDTVEVTTLSGNTEDLPAENSKFTVLPEHKNVLARVAAGEGPHCMTGPIEVIGAMPGDELAVEILAVELAQDWGWNVMKPGKGTLPDDFPQERRIHVAIDRARPRRNDAVGPRTARRAVFRHYRRRARAGGGPAHVRHPARLRR